MDKLVSQEQLQEILSVGRSTLFTLRRRGDFPPHIQLSARRIAWRQLDIEQWLAQRQRAGGAP